MIKNSCLWGYFSLLAYTDFLSRTPAGVTVMLKWGDHDPVPAEQRDRCLFGKVTEWWNLKKRMRHFMDLRKHMRGELFEPLSCSKWRETKSYQRWMRFIWGWIRRSAFTVTSSKAIERAQTICKAELFKPLHFKAKGQCLWSDLFRQNSRDGCYVTKCKS